MIVQPCLASSMSVTTPAGTISTFGTTCGVLPSLRAMASKVFPHALKETFGIPLANNFNRSFTGDVSERSMCRPALNATI